MRRTLIGVVIAILVFAGVYGLAASLNVSSSSLGAGSAVVAACQSGTLAVSYTPAYSQSIPGYAATSVTVGNIDTSGAACGGKAIRVTLVDTSNASLGESTGTVPTSGSAMTFTLSGVSASSVAGVHVAISG
jgi:hypothetical protein